MKSRGESPWGRGSCWGKGERERFLRSTRLPVAVAVCFTAATAAAAPDDYLSRLPVLVQKRLDEMSAARAPKITPPVAVPVRWKAVRMGSIDVGAPLLALTAADLDGDNRSELYAVTSREVVAFALRNSKPVELGRVAFAGDRAVPAPRDVVGTAAVEGNELVAASSAWAKELRITLAKGKLGSQPGSGGFVVCPSERMQLVPGRNYFTGDLHGVRCARAIDRTGAPIELRAQLALTGKLAVEVKKCLQAGGCQPLGTYEVNHAGTAFELADANRDGTPEVIVSGYVAPGDPDTVKVIAVGGDDKKPIYRKRFNGGVVGIAVVDNGPSSAATVIVAVRLAGATRVDFWRLN